MCVSVSQVSRFRIQSLGSCFERVNGWFKNNSSPKLVNVRASSVNGRNIWIRRNVSTSTQGSRNSNTKNSVLGGAIPVTRIVDVESQTKIQPFGCLQQRLAQDKNLHNLLTVIVTDLETSGFSKDKHRIIEIAAQDLAGGENSTFQTLINPVSSIPNSHIHGINEYMVSRPGVPRMEELIPIFLQYVESRRKPGGYVMFVAHNGKAFDFPFLMTEFNRCSYEIPQNWLLLDSLPMARENLKSLDATAKPKAKLDDLQKHYNLSRDGQAHRALSDVLLLSQVFGKLTIDLKLSLSDLVLRSYTASEIAIAMTKTTTTKSKKT